MTRTHLRLAIVTAAALAFALPLPADMVERRYSDGPYVAMQRVLTTASNAIPFALFDLILAAVAVAWIALAWRDVHASSRRWRALAAIAVRTGVWFAAAYLVFLATWGLNYRRVPLRDKLPYSESAVTRGAVTEAARTMVDSLNALHAAAHAGPWPPADAVDSSLAAAFARAAADVKLSPATVPARPKRTIFDWYFRKSGTDGMTDPIFLETLLASSVMPFERPFVIAHEWSHLAGTGDEGEANFVAWLACMRGGPPAQYSGALFLYRELASAMPSRDAASIAGALAPGPRADLRAIRDRYTREISPQLSAAGWRIYDSYLRANRVQAGAESYADVVKLVLGVRIANAPVPGLGPEAH